MSTRTSVVGTLSAILLTSVAACSGSDPAVLTVYSGRSEELIAPLIERFTDESGITVEVLYGDSASLSAQLLEEGDKSPADVFFSQAPGPLGSIDGAGLLKALPNDLASLVPAEFRATDGEWIGVSARARVLVYDPQRTPLASLPKSVLGLGEPGSDLTVGIAPTNASFQDFVSALRLDLGDDATLLFLDGLAERGVRTYANNVTIVEAVGRGEIDVGLVNHYYNLELRAQDQSLATENYYFEPGDLGSLVLISGAAILKTSDSDTEAQSFVRFLLGASSQQYFAQETYEYPLVTGIPGPAGQPPLAELGAPEFDAVQLGQELTSTLTLINEAGLVG
jgi:iron(III) transport system substrate-binding protein